MKQKLWMTLMFVASMVICSQLYAEEAKETSKVLSTAAKPVKGVASGVVNVGAGAKELVEETVEQTKTKPAIVGTIEGIHKGSEKAVDKTVKGAYKAATLGFGELDEVRKEQPKRDPDYENIDSRKSGKPTTFKFKLPW